MKLLRALALSFILIYAGSTLGTAAFPEHNRAEYALERLDLSNGQKAKLKQYIGDSKSGTRQSRKGIEQERARLMNLYSNYNLNVSQAKASVAKINHFQLDLLNRRLDRRMQVRSILSQTQFNRFRQIMGQMPKRPLRFDEDVHPRRAGGRLPQLSLRADQQAQIEKMWKDEASDRRRILGSMTNALQDIERIYANYRVDEKAARSEIKHVNAAQLQLLQLRLDRQVEIRKVLTRQQFNALAGHMRQAHPRPRDRQ